MADDGVFAILYALLVLVMVGTAAVVVDLAMLRESRASTRSAADSAVLAAAASLIPVRPSPNDPSTGCRRAWQYLMDSLGGSGPNQLHDGSGSCTVFPLLAVDTLCPTTPITATNTGFGWTVAVTWPVRDDSDLMLKPDLAPASVTQSVETGFDGTNPCARVGLEIFKSNSPFFAGVFGSGAVQTRAASVARATDDVLAALNILEPTRCAALTTAGQGSIIVNGTGGNAGLIAVESDGLTSSDSDCDDSNAVIAASGGSVKASGPGATGPGLIQAFALNPAPIGNPTEAYTGDLSPVPTVLPARYSATPVTDVFNCASAVCAPGGGPWIDELESALGGVGTPTIAYSGAEPPYSTAAFVQLTDSVVPGFSCSSDPAPIVIVPVGNWYINCPTGLKISKTLIFQGGVIVTDGAIDVVGDDGCLAVNVPATICPSPDTAATPVSTNPPPTGDAILYLRSGRLFKQATAKLLLPQTFTHLDRKDGSIDLEPGAGSLLWTTPLARDCPSSDVRCSNRRFKRLALWSESDRPHRIGGQSTLAVRGVLFTPNARSRFDNRDGGDNQMGAQFWTRKLDVGGNGTLDLAVDPDAAVARPQPGVALIR